MINVYLLRHGQTAWNADNNRYCGRTDIPLTETGLRQAGDVREQLKRMHFEAVYSSPLQRAFQTAKIVSGREDVIADQRLIEADFGNWEGRSREDFINEGSWSAWSKDPMTAQAGDSGESAGDIIKRVDEFFQSLQQKHKQGNILVIAHQAVNRFYMTHKLGMSAKDYRKIYFDNSSVSMFELEDDGTIMLKLLNCGAAPLTE